jgi:hypothetical protein
VLITAPRCTITATLGLATKLLAPDEGECGTEVFVLDDRGLRSLVNISATAGIDQATLSEGAPKTHR